MTTEQRKEELIKEYNILIGETYSEIERLVVKKFEKTKVIQEKLKAIEEENGKKDIQEETKAKK